MSANPNPKTLIAAFGEACNTGQIAITKETATILMHMTQLEDLMNVLVDDFTAPYDHAPDMASSISDRIYDAYDNVKKALQDEFKEHLAGQVFSNIYFEGL
ncbi:MAG: hypothetical protein IKO23_09690 [Bacteroidales bacterium]|nr:hypothetical protein [Bacteroidales bacterium]